MLNAAQLIRRELLIRIVRAFDNGTLRSELDRIPVRLRPKNAASSRCCVYHDRAVIKYRLMALLGISADDETDESKPLKEYFDDVTGDAESCTSDAGMVKPQLQPLTVCGPACSGCPAAAVVSTANCRGCFARPCTTA
ncbi:MAG: Fe-hydrogenase large subunit family protein, partial [Kiritimatiellae bacterium]|nr:Fe-hydrogenase large subunit family protein [Kiritimatiellia bacterium]